MVLTDRVAVRAVDRAVVLTDRAAVRAATTVPADRRVADHREATALAVVRAATTVRRADLQVDLPADRRVDPLAVRAAAEVVVNPRTASDPWSLSTHDLLMGGSGSLIPGEASHGGELLGAPLLFLFTLRKL